MECNGLVLVRWLSRSMLLKKLWTNQLDLSSYLCPWVSEVRYGFESTKSLFQPLRFGMMIMMMVMMMMIMMMMMVMMMMMMVMLTMTMIMIMMMSFDG
jgi:hypothetical protein